MAFSNAYAAQSVNRSRSYFTPPTIRLRNTERVTIQEPKYDPDLPVEYGACDCPGCGKRITVWRYQAWRRDRNGRLAKQEYGVHFYCVTKARSKLGNRYFVGTLEEASNLIRSAKISASQAAASVRLV